MTENVQTCPCCDGRGWDTFDEDGETSNEHGRSIQRCDECERFDSDDEACASAMELAVIAGNVWMAAHPILECDRCDFWTRYPDDMSLHRIGGACAPGDLSHRECGHSACGQNYIDTGERACVIDEADAS